MLRPTADNSGYAVRLRSPKLFATLRASYTRKTLGDILLGGHRNKCEVRIYYLLDGYKW